MANSGTITEYRGIRGLVCALVTTDTAAKYECGVPFFLAGTSELTKETESSSEAHYYDNVPGVVIDSVGADTISVNVSAVSLENIAKITGQYYDPTTETLVESNNIAPYVAIGYITDDTDGSEKFVWRYKGKFARPGSTHATKDNGTSANGQTLTFTGINTTYKFSTTGKTASGLVTTASKCGKSETEFFDKVTTIDDIVPACVVTFTATPSSTTIIVKRGGDVITPDSSGNYHLCVGDYSYTATEEGYVTQSDVALKITASDVEIGTKMVTVTMVSE